MISAILFDMGGTLDADGEHWLDRFYAIYPKVGLGNIAQERIKKAFYEADERIERDPDVRSYGLRNMMQRHVRLQFESLGIHDTPKEQEMILAFVRPVERVMHRNRHILERLYHLGYDMGIVSNYYGNIDTLCQEAGYKPFLKVIIDSAVVGIRKPDLKIFQMALDGLKRPGTEVAFVGDSTERDILPAKALGMKTFWLMSGLSSSDIPAHPADEVLHSLEELPQRFGPAKSAAGSVPA